jgi:Flp pilus assembly protein TadD
LALKPGFADACNNMGVALNARGEIDEAVASCQRALQLNPNLAEAHGNLGHALLVQGKPEEAVVCYRQAREARPGDAGAHNGLGAALRDQGKLTDAIACFHRALALEPDLAEAHNNLGLAFEDQGKMAEAFGCYSRAWALKPDLAETQCNLARCFIDQGKPDEAIACVRRAAEMSPDSVVARKNLAIILLLLGRYEEGWREYEQRLRCLVLKPRSFLEPRWNGERADGKTILIYSDQGFGDTLQFMRYAPFVRPRSGADRVILEVQPELARLLRRANAAGFEIVSSPRSGEAPLPPFDCQVPLLSLPLALGIFEPLPVGAEYLPPDPLLQKRWRDRLGPKSTVRVGLAWAGNPDHKADRHRSIRPETILPLLAQPGFSFYSLQLGNAHRRAQPLLDAGLLDLTGQITDFADTAAFLAELDLIITVDTSVAHLAGAMGRPVWTLLPRLPDWRWGLDADRTAWYPTMRLFRQPRVPDWPSVIQTVAEELKRSILPHPHEITSSQSEGR